MALTSKDDFARVPHPSVYRLVGPNDEFGGLFASATAAAEVGKRTWPDTPQYADCDGMGAFWDVEVVEAG